MEYVLKTNALTKVFKNHKAVNNVDMHIKKGEVYGFIGENGAGKTTIIRLITGVSNKTSGDIELFGVDTKSREIRMAKRRMAAVVESPSIYLNMSAYDNLVQQCKLLGIVDESIIRDTLTTVGLADLINNKKNAGRFSLGMRQRLGIAMALIGNPDFIILDEPMNGLDPQGIIEIRELIIKLNREKGITFLISSHILDELAKVATCYGFIHNGCLIKEISAAELHEECRKCTEIVVDDLGLAIKALDSCNGVESYKTLPNNTLRIYGEFSVKALVKVLDENNVDIIKYNTNDENIEEYYLNLMGGKKNA